MSCRIRRVDDNQARIVKRFRDLGCLVHVLSHVGQGFPDIIVALPRPGRLGFLHLVEIKDGSKPPSARKLTSVEQVFHDKWWGFVSVVSTEDEATDIVEKALKGEI